MGYTGQVNVKCEMSKAMLTSDTQDGVKIGVCWGGPSSLLTSAPYSWGINNVFSPYDSPEWAVYSTNY